MKGKPSPRKNLPLSIRVPRELHNKYSSLDILDKKTIQVDFIRFLERKLNRIIKLTKEQKTLK